MNDWKALTLSILGAGIAYAKNIDATFPDAALQGASAMPRTIFMVRQFESWAKSIVQSFATSPAKLLKKYETALR